MYNHFEFIHVPLKTCTQALLNAWKPFNPET